MSGPLSPLRAAELASQVYTLTEHDQLDSAVKVLQALYKGNLAILGETALTGRTGAIGFLKCRTAFGLILIGQQSLKNNVFIVVRGTHYLADWLTNINATLSRTYSGQPVHDGFNTAFESIKPQIQQALPAIRGATIHCIGHSLGGALAALCAEWLASVLNIQPFLYTYGCPRPGLQGFSDRCIDTIGPSRIFRVYHSTDIVPCIPIWPFIHVPNRERSYSIRSPGVIPTAEYHKMGNYRQSVDRHTWEVLEGFQSLRWMIRRLRLGCGNLSPSV